MTHPADKRLAEIRASAYQVATIRTHLHWQIREAHKNGASLREIAKAAGVSYETVRRITTS
jgi:lambda repressor-like predicted transcriptional regulator